MQNMLSPELHREVTERAFADDATEADRLALLMLGFIHLAHHALNADAEAVVQGISLMGDTVSVWLGEAATRQLIEAVEVVRADAQG